MAGVAVSIGAKVKYTVDDIEYLGIVIANDTVDNIYRVSIEGLGKVIESDGSDIEAI